MTLGIDIGAHKIALVAYDGEILAQTYEAYPTGVVGDYERWFSWASELVERFLKSAASAPNQVGIAVAGIVKNGTVVRSPNLPILDGRDLKAIFTQGLKTEVRVNNDARCFLQAESQLGAARGFKNVVGLTLGTGVGGALLINGEIYRGEHASAGEVGHMVLEGVQTFEDLVSKRGFARFSDLLPTELARQARAGDKEAQRVFREVGKYLGRGLGNLINIVDPEAVVIGGGIGLTLDLLLPGAQEEAAKIIINPEARPIPILPAHFKEFASALGAALLD